MDSELLRKENQEKIFRRSMRGIKKIFFFTHHYGAFICSLCSMMIFIESVTN